jgi:hypothetical protein
VGVEDPLGDGQDQAAPAPPFVERHLAVRGFRLEGGEGFFVAELQCVRRDTVVGGRPRAHDESVGRHQFPAQRSEEPLQGVGEPGRAGADERGVAAQLQIDGDLAIRQRRQLLDRRRSAV